MKILCSKSGMHYTMPDFPKSHISQAHPIFAAPPKTLLRAFEEFLAGRCTPQETILLFLALADSTGLMVFRDPFDAGAVPEDAVALFSAHMENLGRTVARLSHITGKGLELPKIVCERAGQQNTAHAMVRCIKLWKEELDMFSANAANAARAQEALKLEERLQKAARMLQLRPATYATNLAEWAASVGAFPDNLISTHRHPSIPKSAYYKEVIKNCVMRNGKSLTHEIAEVLEFCEQNIDVEDSTIHALALFDALRTEYRAKFGTLGYSITATRASNIPLTRDEQEAREREIALLKSIRDASPSTQQEEPKRSQFASDFSYLRAIAAWRIAKTVAAVEGTAALAAPATVIIDTDSGEL